MKYADKRLDTVLTGQKWLAYGGIGGYIRPDDLWRVVLRICCSAVSLDIESRNSNKHLGAKQLAWLHHDATSSTSICTFTTSTSYHP